MQPNRLRSYFAAAALALTSVAPAIAQSNLDADRRPIAGDTSPPDHTAAAAREQALILGGASPLVVQAAAFSDDSAIPGTSFFSFASGQIAGGSYGCSMAPVYLPDGAEVTSLYVSVVDNGPSNLSVALRKRDNFFPTATNMAQVTSSGEPGLYTISTSSITSPVVSRVNDSVYLTGCFGTDLGILSARIHFTP